MDRPVVVVIDCCHKPPSPPSSDCQRLLRDILGDQHSMVPVKTTFSSDAVDMYLMQLETKYYTSDVGLCVFQSPTIGSQQFAEAVESVILYLSKAADLEKDDSFASFVDPWLSFIQHWEETAVKILACTRTPSGSSGRLAMQQWCIKNDFELVELDPDDEALTEADDCGEVTGVRRILQALRAHSWSNLVMKDERTMDADRAERLRTYLQEKDHETLPDAETPNASSGEPISTLSSALRQAAISDSSAAASATSKPQPSSNEKLHSDVDHLLGADDQASLFRVANAGGGGGDPDCGNVSFEELFAKFAEMKETAASLPPEQRKAYAEKVTIEFWRAIGGDESEIADLGDSSEDDEGVNVSAPQ